MREKYLPIGSVVMLKGGEKKVMIVSYLIFSTGKSKTKTMYDYGGCVYPEGIIDSRVGVGFNHSDIAEILHVGYEDDEEKEMSKLLKENAEKVKEEYLKTLENSEEKEEK